ncbi:SDR family oxidoreductase [Leucobacter allii]|uniref:SDR family NAD(P)-dependent oxidoreductase n=1 Tax=Leucobacter allii TaxID=2932247 RepID=UPI001FD24A13|nr:SDR family NAD(P)-dependent oxidoreductase [Leucobacter allii]UOR01327.1 SDR family oxidoreductase [Leucobacter allii]
MSEQRSIACITGASGGQGRVAVEKFVAEGYRVVAADLLPEAVERVRDEIVARVPDADILAIGLDQSSEESLREAAARVREWGGRIDALLLFAGVVQRDGVPLLSMSTEEWDRVQGVNLRGVFLACRELAPLIPAHAGGSIVTISSWWGQSGHPFYSAYCSSKAGVISLTQCLAAELADAGIRVNSVAPGNIDTEMHRAALRGEAEERGISFDEMRDIEWGKIPLKTAGPPSSIVEAAFWLASERSAYVTGATIDVNGGVKMR